MKVLQLIDSLNAGGAERMAVNIANALIPKIEKSYLCTTREEGSLKSALKDDVGYLFLKKKSALDPKAVLKLSKYVKNHGIEIIHAHSSSYFLAVLVKVTAPKVKIFWHDHYGNSDLLDKRPKTILSLCSSYFTHSFVVNKKLEAWALNNLKHQSVSFLPNFIDMQQNGNKTTVLKGETGSRVVCLANLRPQKDHVNLLKAFYSLLNDFPDCTLHCVGKDFKDAYSKEVYQVARDLKLSKNVFFYGSCNDIASILMEADIGVLSSKSEGLPLALLEYGRAGLPVVVTDVGDCASVVDHGNSGIVVKPQNSKVLFNGLKILLEDKDKAQDFSSQLKQTVLQDYSVSAAIETILWRYNQI